VEDVSIAPLDALSLTELLAGPAADLATVAQALSAHALAAAESFSELLALGSLHGVERHAYQVETVQRLLRTLRGRALLADEVGLGKTIEAIMALREYQLRGMVRRALIITPPALVGQWVAELSSKAGIVARHTDEPQLRLDPDDFWRGDGVVVASLALARAQRHAPHVQARPWDLVIVDEAHRVKNRATLGWKLVDGLKSRFLLLLTATPIENDLEELYQLVTLLKPGQFATPAQFRQQFVDPKDPTQPRNRESLRRLLGEVMIRNTRARCGLKLPPRFVTTINIEPAAEERALYDGVLDLLRAHAGDGRARQQAATLLVEAGSSPHALVGTLARLRAGKHAFGDALPRLHDEARRVAGLATTKKGTALVELLAAHRDQALVFSRFRATLAWLDELFTRHGLAHVVVHGGIDGEAKQAAFDAFRSGARLLLATDVGSEGHNLQHCHLLVNFDLPWNPMVIEQRIGRLHRFGQTEEVQVYNLCAKGTVEERILDVLDRRVQLFELVVGEMDMVLGNLADERDLEERIVQLYAEARGEAELAHGFDAIAEELLRARGHYERARALDQSLFGKDFEA
jgi:SNF2 family DNA or RNA helicase